MMKRTGQSDAAQGLEIFSDSKRAVANLMARENVSVQIVPGAQTAGFDPINRVLVIPAWTGLTVEQTDLLMSHEIGHALFSDAETFEKLHREDASFFSYVNIVEDARIERKMKNAFPGLSRVFYNGYSQFHSNGPILNGTKTALVDPRTGTERPIAGMKLIDRINLYYKIGAFCTVPFTAEEQVWIAKIDRAGSMEQVVEIARALYAQAPAQPNQAPQQGQPQQGQSGQQQDNTEQSGDDQAPQQGDGQSQDPNAKDGDQDGTGTDGDQDAKDTANGDQDAKDTANGDQDAKDTANGDDAQQEGAEHEAEAPQAGPGAGTGAAKEAAETAQDMEEILKGLAKSAADQGEIAHLLMSPLPEAIIKARTVTAVEWSTDGMERMRAVNPAVSADLDALETAWNAQFLSTAQHMALEFERRKNAKALQNAKVAKTGKLNLTKLHAYKFTDDLFIRSCTMPNGKSHGVVMVIDGSGSMSDTFANVMDQVLLFAHFAQKVQIPFEAYMFTDATRSGRWDCDEEAVKEHRQGTMQINLSDSGRLVGLVNTKQGNFKQQIRTVLALRALYNRRQAVAGLSYEAHETFRHIPYANLGGTPLFTGMMLGEAAVARMKRTHRLDKMTFVVVTDGEDGGGLNYEGHTANRYDGKKTQSLCRTAFVVRDTVTKQNFVQAVKTHNSYYGDQVTQPENAIFTMLMDVIKARHDCRTVAMYLQTMGGGRRRRRYHVESYIDGVSSLTRAGVDLPTGTMEAAKLALTEDGQYALPEGVGLADLALVIKSSSLALTENEFGDLNTEGMTQKKIQTAFVKQMVKNITNRKFCSTLIPFLV